MKKRKQMGFKRIDADQWIVSTDEGSICLMGKQKVYSTEWVKEHYKIGREMTGNRGYGGKDWPFRYITYALSKL